MRDSRRPLARARITPAGLMFLAIASIGWGFNWPVTKYLIGELPPLTMRGGSGVVGALLLAALALVRRQSLHVPRAIWPRLLVAAVLNVTGWMVLMGLALLWLPASEAALRSGAAAGLGGCDRHHGGAGHRRGHVRDRAGRAARVRAGRSPHLHARRCGAGDAIVALGRVLIK